MLTLLNKMLKKSKQKARVKGKSLLDWYLRYLCASAELSELNPKHNPWRRVNWDVKSILLVFCYWFLNGFSSWKPGKYSVCKLLGAGAVCRAAGSGGGDAQGATYRKFCKFGFSFHPLYALSHLHVSIILRFQRSKGKKKPKSLSTCKWLYKTHHCCNVRWGIWDNKKKQ